MSEVMFHCVEGSANKFWSYEKNGTDVVVKWGRCGLSGQSLVQQFGSSAAADAFIAQKVREKIRKGYKQVTQEEMKKQVDLAKELGWQHKIDKLKWGRLNEGKQEILLTRDYDEEQYVYVEILNSWTKDRVRLLLGKNKSYYIDGVAFQDQTVAYSTLRNASSSDSFVTGVRGYLKRLSDRIVEVVKVKIGSFGRKLNLGLGTEPSTAVAEEVEESVFTAVGESSSAVSEEVIGQIAQLGSRKLCLF